VEARSNCALEPTVTLGRLFSLSSLVGMAAVASIVHGEVRCPPDAVLLGDTLCVDRYEASVWRVPPGQTALVKKLKRGKATLADLTAGGATQLCPVPLGNNSCTSCTYGPTFPDNGSWTEPVYAAAIPGVLPSSCITWFQAAQACRLVGKRLLTNEEWQVVASGTPDPGDADDGTTTCNTKSEAPSQTGSRRACVSSWGAHDMAGNVWEWVADWMDLAQGETCGRWGPDFGDDLTCVGPNVADPQPTPGSAAAVPRQPREIPGINPHMPGGVIRGGNFATGTRNGIFAVFAGGPPNSRSRSTGFRCARGNR
jgi:formylglycine-generating enzyme required for sulfatase activity